jgi:hypothetical protein
MDGQDEGTIHRARITEMITDDEYERTKDPEVIKFRLSVNNDEYKLIMPYGEVLNHHLGDGPSIPRY